MKSPSIICPLAVAILALIAPTLQAENAPPVTVLDLSLKDTPLSQVAEQLRSKAAANIVLSPEVSNLKVPEIALTNVTAEGVLQSLAAVMPQILLHISGNDRDGVIFNVTQNKPAPSPSNKVCRVFKANTKDKLQGKELETLMQNLTDAATMVCEVNAKAQGLEPANVPVIQAHAPTGILIVAGKESDVALVGQVILALGGEAVPSTETSKVSWLPWQGAAMNGGNMPFSVQMSGVKIDPQSGAVQMLQGDQLTKQLEDVRQQLEKSRGQSSEAAKQVQEAMKHLKIEVKPTAPAEATSPKAPAPPEAPSVKP